MPNTGVVPLDASTPVGQVRLNVGDTNSVPLDPDEAGFGSYDYFSDAAIVAFLAASNASVTRATGTAIKQLSLNAAMTGRLSKTDDLSLDNRQRGTDLLAIAKSWFDQADAEDAATLADIFEIVPLADRVDEYGSYVPVTSFRFVEDPNNPGFLIP